MKALLFCLCGILIGCGGTKENIPVTIDLSTPSTSPSAKPVVEVSPEARVEPSVTPARTCAIKIVCNVNDPDAPIGYVVYTSEEGDAVERRTIIDYNSPKHVELATLIKQQGRGVRGPEDSFWFVCLPEPLALLPPSP